MLKFRRYERSIEGSGPSQVDSGASEQAFHRGLPISPGTVRPALVLRAPAILMDPSCPCLIQVCQRLGGAHLLPGLHLYNFHPFEGYVCPKEKLPLQTCPKALPRLVVALDEFCPPGFDSQTPHLVTL